MLYRGEFEGGCFCRAIRYRFVDLLASMIAFPQSKETLFRIPGSAVTRVGATNRC